MSIFDALGNYATLVREAYFSDGKKSTKTNVNFGNALDVSSNLPKKDPGGWFDSAESFRQKSLGTAEAVMEKTLAPAVGWFERKTNIDTQKWLEMAPKNVRSNYAFIRQTTDENAAMGFISMLGMVGGGIAGGLVGALTLNPVGIVAGVGLGVGLAGKAERSLAKTDLIGDVNPGLKNSAIFSESIEGQEKYNFGRDTTTLVSQITGYEKLGDNSQGVGAIVSGIINFGLEVTVAPDILGFKAAGVVGREALNAPLASTRTGLISKSKMFDKFEAKNQAIKIADDIDTLKRTQAGETTRYSPVFKFYRENDASVIQKRPEFNNDIGRTGANLVAGQDDNTIGLILRAGRGDAEALTELAVKRADKKAELDRFQADMKITEIDGVPVLTHRGLDAKALNAETAAIRKEVKYLDDALSLNTQLIDRTVGRVAFVERLRNDRAKNIITRKLETGTAVKLETGIGRATQSLYLSNPFGKVVRFVDRTIDDTPHQTIKFDDVVQASDRFRTNVRSAVKVGAIAPEDSIKAYNGFLTAATESEKFLYVEKYNATVMKGIGAKYNLAPEMIDQVVEVYNRTNRKMVADSKSAKALNENYMINPHNADELISDPQLITQLANGTHVIDVSEVDKAFKQYRNKMDQNHGGVQFFEDAAKDKWVMAKYVADEFNGIWRGLTLARAGYPLNIIRDTTIRMFGDMALIPVYAKFSQKLIKDLANSANSPAKIKNWIGGTQSSKINLKNIRRDIDSRVTVIDELKKAMTKSKYDNAGVERLTANINEMQAVVDGLRVQEAAIVAKMPSKTVGKGVISVDGYDFPDATSGRYGEMTAQALRGQDDVRRALSSLRELEIVEAKRGRTGSRSIVATENESLHLQAWEQVLNDKLRFDDVARQIMEGKSKAEVTTWLKAPENFNYLDRFALRASDAGLVYDRVRAAVDQFAPSIELQKLVVSDGVDILSLKKLYPDLNERPTVLTDLADDALGTSNAYQKGVTGLKEFVSILATMPASKLAYSPYFAYKYEQKLQSQIAVATAQGRKLTAADKKIFEKSARDYGISEYKAKLNSFHRDMNYNGLINYMIAFFPALVEQFRAYGRIAYDNPEFLVKISQVASIPERVLNSKIDQYGEEFIEMPMPFGLTGRLNAAWFNPINPTGGQLASAGPLASATVNAYSNYTLNENFFTKMVLGDFGATSNYLNALTPNTVRRLSQVFSGTIGKSGEQFNKDTFQMSMLYRKEFLDNNDREPTSSESNKMDTRAMKAAQQMAVLRFVNSVVLPSQPSLKTPLAGYSDMLSKYRTKFGVEGEAKFIEDFPDYFMLADSLSDSTSGIVSDLTAVTLLKENLDVVKKISATINESNLNVLGAIFNDDDYAFSSVAQSYLEQSTIPGQTQKFKNSSAALAATRSSVISRGWRDYNKLIDIVTIELKRENLNPGNGYGKSLMDKYKNAFVEQQKVQNNQWYQEKTNFGGGGGQGKEKDTVNALTIAMNTPKLWKNLSKQPRWHTIKEYMNLRYDVNATLKRMGTSYSSQDAWQLRQNVSTIVESYKAKDINFGKFYERYFSNDTFSYVSEGI